MTTRFIRNVVIKGLLIFAVINFSWALVPHGAGGGISAYNSLLRGRERFPFGETPGESYNLSLYNVEAMFASHKLDAVPKAVDEFRVFVIGDSAAWGTLLRPEETLAGVLDAAELESGDGRRVRVYNLGYPTLSLVKDLMVLERSIRYEPDLILWRLTLESFPRERQLESPIVANNPQIVDGLITRYDLQIEPPQVDETLWQRTLIGQRRQLADLLRLQFYGVMWSATGIDQLYPEDYPPADRDLEADVSFHNWQPPQFPSEGLALDLVSAGMEIADDVPVVIINEPILFSSGENSEIRYNFYYPRWAYDLYRQQLAAASESNSWRYLDLWNLVPEANFTNSAIHLDSAGEEMVAEKIIESGVIQ